MTTVREATGACTLVELLVAIAIIGIPIAILLPTVQAVREAARRVVESRRRNDALGSHAPRNESGFGANAAKDGKNNFTFDLKRQ